MCVNGTWDSNVCFKMLFHTVCRHKGSDKVRSWSVSLAGGDTWQCTKSQLVGNWLNIMHLNDRQYERDESIHSSFNKYMNCDAWAVKRWPEQLMHTGYNKQQTWAIKWTRWYKWSTEHLIIHRIAVNFHITHTVKTHTHSSIAALVCSLCFTLLTSVRLHEINKPTGRSAPI